MMEESPFARNQIDWSWTTLDKSWTGSAPPPPVFYFLYDKLLCWHRNNPLVHNVFQIFLTSQTHPSISPQSGVIWQHRLWGGKGVTGPESGTLNPRLPSWNTHTHTKKKSLQTKERVQGHGMEWLYSSVVVALFNPAPWCWQFFCSTRSHEAECRFDFFFFFLTE